MVFPSAYELVRQETIAEIKAEGYLLKHKKTGARLLLIDTDDTNKVFTIGFRTPPADDTGVPHIMEHSVLCGSDRYPLKDPFVELVKGSLNTFLNAMTYPDKTLYPIASVNDQDFKNLMSVYMDAVLCPNIYKTENIFRQEGWHYEVNEDGDLVYNGVVYNEMKGAFSDPEGVLDRVNKAVLFPDTAYANESGGDPDSIPDLTYEAFLDFHRTYYHPSNSYIYLYGKMDFSERLQWLDETYLSKYDYKEVDSEIRLQKPFSEMKEKTIYCGGSDEEESGMLSYSVVCGSQDDTVRSLALEVLSYALLNAPGAPVKQALLDAGIGSDIYGGYDDGLRQPMFTITAKGAASEQKADFLHIIRSTMEEQAAKGLSEKTLRAGIHNIEFSVREADFGRYPKGLVYGLQAYGSWIYDENEPFRGLSFEEDFEKLRDCLKTEYFEELIRHDLLENTHAVLIDVVPKDNFTAEKEEELAKKLAEVKASLTPEEFEQIKKNEEALREYQETPEDPENLQCIPLLSLSDLKTKVSPFDIRTDEAAGVSMVCHEIPTAGIGYVDLSFPLDALSYEELPYAALLKNLLTMLDTEHYSYQELNDEISLKTGGLGFETSSYLDAEKKLHLEFCLRGKTLYPDMEAMFELSKEAAFLTDFSDDKRIHEVISEIYVQMQDGMVNSGHVTALRRVLSYSSEQAYVDDLLQGVGFYRFLRDLLKNYDDRKAELIEKMRELIGKIFYKQNALLSYTGDPESVPGVKKAFETLAGALYTGTSETKERYFVPERKNEGFRTSSMVQYAAAGGLFTAKGYEFTGAFRVLKTLLGYEYLWQNVRVKGGAYGCMSQFTRDGEMAFVSYRDPNLKETLNVFNGIPEFIRHLELTERDRVQYILGTVSEMDTPLTPSMRGRRSLMAYKSGMTMERIQKERDQVLQCTEEDLRALADCVEAVLSDGAICVVGEETKIEGNSDIFGETVSL